uniref:Kef-type K+ transport systems, predicted NAD-binding component n=1 Tax=uncultured Planctomycetales bacterium HF0500_02G17 TaxID=723608 RepID=E7C4L7_9BACT|nr:Kef-type K+ transport systems, predicted NAD-binding component [uncultured Planctomycetales bacterium HF0500_02G17]
MISSADGPLRSRVYRIIFGTGTPMGRAFDVALLLAIVGSVLVVMLESVAAIRESRGTLLIRAEWVFTGFFTVEYLLRLWCVKQPGQYARSFFGMVDLLAILPTYISLLVPGSQALIVIRALRLIRVFRVLKLARFVGESAALMDAVRASLPKIAVFLVSVITLVMVIGSAMYLIEGGAEGTGFTSIPQGVYWAIVTMTTVGYGDVSPITPAGKMLASVVMIMGYGIIAVPTGIVTAELTSRRNPKARRVVCPECASDDHDADARFCKNCGESLSPV